MRLPVPPRPHGRRSPTSPGPPVGVDEEAVDLVAVGPVGERRALERRRWPLLDLFDLGDGFLEGQLAGTDCHHARALRLGHRQRQPPGLEQLHALVAEPGGVHRVLRVVAVRLNQLGPVDPLLPTHPEQSFLLPLQVAEIAAPRPTREQRRPQLA
ncbi:MAG TPA: hypothetical protein VLA87_08410 [Gaiellaceae bacterium]|nr:hypothetical protein [Gaiellaceae bacterium]